MFRVTIEVLERARPYVGVSTDTTRYTHQSQVLSLFYRWVVDESSWCLPVMFLLLNDLRDLAEQVSGLVWCGVKLCTPEDFIPATYVPGGRLNIRINRQDAFAGGMYTDSEQIIHALRYGQVSQGILLALISLLRSGSTGG